ncbi:hypothetical protein Kpol_1044p31 [Vanderwaltozyma polyspora DSM 70294]|uniref:Uncharacterized protein n=1 Tax=Vanderwaltozyma polyspora (strain ATCC 22028 / DSM 70294 / BCRC 21397 / CBS 2163 / NBRC 10782 / NRRL Y-8283 / UCD 57-17) TaxID=436907 RepID=A7TP61_VANPO|nr:uncharacterized protein Kpol_1044p31 [Vanderwaltozyma polyspora DSM 70294]EDO15971.1 hypothetical protein Kpol_1044p31 [Vanderwaltozyma polyspora DSM 70294]
MSFFSRSRSTDSKSRAPDSKSRPIIISIETAASSALRHATGDLRKKKVEKVKAKKVAAPKKVKIRRDPPVRAKKTAAHLRSLPIVQQTQNGLNKLSLTRIVYSETKYTSLKVIDSRFVQFFAPFTIFTDDVMNSGLVLVETLVPSLKTKTYNRLGEEFMFPYNFVATWVSGVAKKGYIAFENNYRKPGHDQLVRYRKFYNKKYINTNGKPLLRGIFDPIFLPANNMFENLTIKFLPIGNKVPSDGFCCEFDRGFALTGNFLVRGATATGRQITSLVSMPFIYMNHMNNVYNDELDKELRVSFRSSIKALGRTNVYLETEAIEAFKNSSTGKLFQNNDAKRITDADTLLSETPKAEENSKVEETKPQPVPLKEYKSKSEESLLIEVA